MEKVAKVAKVATHVGREYVLPPLPNYQINFLRTTQKKTECIVLTLITILFMASGVSFDGYY